MNYFKIIGAPIGKLTLVAGDHGLHAVLWENDDPKRVRVDPHSEKPNHPILLETEQQLTEYFNGSRTHFSVTLNLVGTDFQKQVWEQTLPAKTGK